MASNQAPPPFLAQMREMLVPAEIMKMAFPYYIGVFKETVFNQGQIFAPITQISRLRDEAFGKFWVNFTKARADPNAEPVGSSALIPPLLKSSTGIVLDIGPGTGTQMPLLTSKSITALYGPEPCTGLHAELRSRAAEQDISEKYHILPCGVSAAELLPALRKTGTGVVDAYDADESAGVFDTILCVRVLCSVPEMDRTVKELYGLLRPGGRLLVTEHVVNRPFTAKGSLIGRLVQGVYMFFGWRFLIGDCCLDRETEGALRGAAGDEGWESVELERSFEWSAMPYLSGVLTKKK